MDRSWERKKSHNARDGGIPMKNGQREYTSLGMVSSTESSSCANRMDRSMERKKSHEALNYTFGAGVDHKPLEIHRGAYPLVFSLDLA